MNDNNFVSVRIKTLNTQQTIGQVKHDTRQAKIDYIRNDNKNIFLNNDLGYINDNYYGTIKSIYLDSINRQKQTYKNTFNQKSQLQKNSISGIITFSNTMIEDYKNNKDTFLKNTKENIKQISQLLDVDLIYITIHLDEKTPHIHFLMNNFDTETGKGKSKELYQNKQQLQQLQDLSGEIWKDFGKGYQRGISKTITSKNHYSVLEGHKKEIEETIATYQIKLKELKDLRNQLQQIDLDITQKKEIYNQITQQQKKVREYIQSTKTTLKQLKNDIGKDTDKIINSIPTFRFGQNDEELKKIIKQILYKNHKREISAVKDKNEEITQLKKSNQELKENISQIDTKTTQNEDLIKNQYKTITKLENTLKIKKNNIKILEEKLNFNYLEELEKIKQQNDNDKLNQIQKEKDRNKLNSEIDRYKKDTNISYSFPGDL